MLLLGALAPAVGRGLARAIRTLAGPWWLAAADGHHPEAAKTAAAAFKETFPGRKAAEALRYCHTQVGCPQLPRSCPWLRPRPALHLGAGSLAALAC